MKPINRYSGIRLSTLFILILMAISPPRSFAQEIHGFKILAIPNGITLLKFNDKIEKWDFAKPDLFTVNVDDGVKLRVLCLVNDPASTQMSVTEGSRTHVFNVEIKTKNVDINTFNGFYDYSDLKALKKQIAAGMAKPSPTASEPPSALPAVQQTAATQQSEKQTKSEKAQAEKKRKQQEKEAAELAKKEEQEAARQQATLAKQQAAQKAEAEKALKERQQAKADADAKLAAAETEKSRLKAEKAARERTAREEKARQQQLEKENKEALAAAKKREDQESKIRRQQEAEQEAAAARREKQIAAAKEKDRQALIAKAAAEKAAEDKRMQAAADKRASQQRKDIEAARLREQQLLAEKNARDAAEKDRIAAENLARKREAELEAARKRQEDIARKKQDELAKEEKRQQALAAQLEQERQKQEEQEDERRKRNAERERQAQRNAELAAVKAAERRDALIKNPYWKTEWHKKYPQINFGEVPPGQTITGEYFLPKDTLANNAVARNVINSDARINRKSDQVNGATMVLEGITFSGVNSFYRIRIINKSKGDFLVGKMMVTWWKKEGGSFYLTPCYITEFPVISAGEEAIVVYGCRGVNADDKDDFLFSLKERRNDEQELKLYYTGSLYNKELNR